MIAFKIFQYKGCKSSTLPQIQALIYFYLKKNAKFRGITFFCFESIFLIHFNYFFLQYCLRKLKHLSLQQTLNFNSFIKIFITMNNNNNQKSIKQTEKLLNQTKKSQSIKNNKKSQNKQKKFNEKLLINQKQNILNEPKKFNKEKPKYIQKGKQIQRNQMAQKQRTKQKQKVNKEKPKYIQKGKQIQRNQMIQQKKSKKIENPQIFQNQKPNQVQKQNKLKIKYCEKQKIVQIQLSQEVLMLIKVKKGELTKIRKQMEILFAIKQIINDQIAKQAKKTTKKSQLKSLQLKLKKVVEKLSEQSEQSLRILIDIILLSFQKNEIMIDLHGFRCDERCDEIDEIVPLFLKIQLLNKNLTIVFNVGAGNHTAACNKINGKAPLRRKIQSLYKPGKVQVMERSNYLMVVQFKSQMNP